MGRPREPGDVVRPARRARVATRAERELWLRAIADVAPLPGRDPLPSDNPPAGVPPPPVTVPPAEPETLLAAGRTARVEPRRSPRGDPAGIGNGLDRRTMLRLRRGSIPPETQVDLHHCTQDQAHRLLTGFLAASQSAGRRCVLVITGKGYGSDGAVGVLKTMVPRWLDEAPNRARILGVSPATPAHGGDGALYVLLRRVRRRTAD